MKGCSGVLFSWCVIQFLYTWDGSLCWACNFLAKWLIFVCSASSIWQRPMQLSWGVPSHLLVKKENERWQGEEAKIFHSLPLQRQICYPPLTTKILWGSQWVRDVLRVDVIINIVHQVSDILHFSVLMASAFPPIRRFISSTLEGFLMSLAKVFDRFSNAVPQEGSLVSLDHSDFISSDWYLEYILISFLGSCRSSPACASCKKKVFFFITWVRWSDFVLSDF